MVAQCKGICTEAGFMSAGDRVADTLLSMGDPSAFVGLIATKCEARIPLQQKNMPLLKGWVTFDLSTDFSVPLFFLAGVRILLF